MTEAEWHACNDPWLMLENLRGNASSRKLRLFAVACARRIEAHIPVRRSRYAPHGERNCQDAIVVAEKFADGLVTAEELREAGSAAMGTMRTDTESIDSRKGFAELAAQACTNEDPFLAAWQASGFSRYAVAGFAEISTEHVAQAALVRELWGRLPFAPDGVSSLPAAAETGVIQLALAAYNIRSFDSLETLAAALERAGCHDADVLSHCRQDEKHVRGCWVVDLVLGKP